MSKLETPMILKYWDQVGGTLIHEFEMVKRGSQSGPRRADAVIIPSMERVILKGGIHPNICEGKDIIVLQAKAHRLGMYLMGQGVFSAELMKKFNPKSIKSVILCTDEDSVLSPFLNMYPNVEVIVMPEFAKPKRRKASQPLATRS
jgi:hypothetical protein